ncbi:MAG: hypothetical protein AAF518_11440 [Spirochaetota bacterium]
MNQMLLFLLSLLVFITACGGKSSNNQRNLALLYLASQQSSDPGNSVSTTMDISSNSGKASAATNVVSSASSSAVNASNVSGDTPTAKNQNSLHVGQQLLELYKNGMDPVLLQSLLTRNRIRKQRAVTYSQSGTDASGNKTYTFSGSLTGKDYSNAVAVYSLQLDSSECAVLTSYNTSCASSVCALANKGTATISNGQYSYPSYTDTNSYTFKSEATISFSEYGTVYLDPYANATALKNANAIQFFTKCPVTSSASNTTTSISLNFSSDDGCTCEDIQSVYGELVQGYAYSIVSGDLTYSYESTYSPVGTAVQNSDGSYTISYVGNSTSIVDSSGITIEQNSISSDTITMSSLQYETEYDYSNIYNQTLTQNSDGSTTTAYSSYSFSGTYKIKISGTLNGSSINETYTISF